MSRKFTAPVDAAFALTFCVLLLSGLSGCESDKSKAEKAYKQKHAEAKALFEERCKTAGVVIKRTVKDVDGIELTKIRQPIPWGGMEYFDPMYAEAAMAGEHRGDNYIKQFLMSEFIDPSAPERRGGLGPPTKEKNRTRPGAKRGYAFVEFVDSSGQRNRCLPDWSRDHPNWVDGQHRCMPVSKAGARYALDYDDIVTPADRTLWVAGTKLKVIDKQTGEVIAQLTRFVWDPGFGVSTTGRWPWQHADSGSRRCPNELSVRGFVSRFFVDQILIPKQGD